MSSPGIEVGDISHIVSDDNIRFLFGLMIDYLAKNKKLCYKEKKDIEFFEP